MLDFTSLGRAVASLALALDAAKAHPGDDLIRDATIQRFEYTFELCIKSLRRKLEEMADSPGEVDALGYRDMIRLGVERRLVRSAPAWFKYRELRNITSHVYDEKKAAQVFEGVPAFLRDARALSQRLSV